MSHFKHHSASLSTLVRRVVMGAVVGMSFVAATASANGISVVSTVNSSGFTVSSTDLLNGRTGVVSGNINSEEGLSSDTTGAALTDGGFGTVGIDGHANPGMVQIHSGVSITYMLPTSAAGYTISSINTYSGWRDAGRVQQDYDVWFAFAGAPTTFFDVFSVASHPTNGNDDMVSLSGPNGGALGNNVVGVRFDFNSVQNGFVGYRELDVFGTAAAAAVPEPASLLLFGLGALALGGSRRKLFGKTR